MPISDASQNSQAETLKREYLPTYAECFVCGENNLGGLGVRFYVEGEVVKGDFLPKDAHVGYQGLVHGGVAAALLDEAMGWPLGLRKGRICVSTEITVRFVRPVTLGRKYLVVAWAVSDNRRLWEAQGEIRDEENVVYAKGRGKYYPLAVEGTEAVDSYLSYRQGDRVVFHRNDPDQ